MSARILIVDDEVIVAESTRLLLRQHGYVITGIAGSSDEAVASLARERPDLVLMDINLGGEHEGIAAADQIRRDHLLPVVYVTAYSDSTTLARAKITHPFGYVTKPFEARDLLVAIEIALHNHVLERRLEESELKFRTLVEEAGDGFELLDEEGRILEVNGATCRRHGYSREEMLRLNITDIDVRLTPERYRQSFRSSLGQPPITIESVHRRKDGTAFPVEITFSIIQINGVWRAMSLVRDITERREAEEELRRVSQWLLASQRISATGGWAINLKAGTVWASPEARRIYGYGDGPLTVPRIQSLPLPQFRPALNRALQDLVAAGRPYDIEFQIVRANDGAVVDIHSLAEYDAAAGEVRGVIQDVTARKRVEAARDALTRTIEQKNRELETLVYATSHDLRTPLLNVQGFSRRLVEGCAEVARIAAAETMAAADRAALAEIVRGELPKAVSHIEAGVDKMDRLIDGLLRLSRLGRAGLKVVRLDVTAIVTDIVAALGYAIQEAGAAVVFEALPACHGDEGQISQLFTNLLDNALKYRDPARPLRVTLSGRVEGGRAIYCVADTGRGIAPKDRERIWEIFYRADPRGPVAGEGIGLNLVRRIVERHEGEIWVESTLGEGSRFYLALPLAREAGAPSPPADPAPGTEGRA